MGEEGKANVLIGLKDVGALLFNAKPPRLGGRSGSSN
jgi:hypothetical protein